MAHLDGTASPAADCMAARRGLRVAAWLVAAALGWGAGVGLAQPGEAGNGLDGVAVETGLEIGFRLDAHGARETFAVTAPADGPGVFILRILESGGHPGPVVRWLDADRAELRPDWDPTVRVAPDETLYAELRSAPYGWQEQAREETVRIRIDFSPEPYPEPNGTPESAVPVEIGEEIGFRLIPRWDRDVFAVTAPAEGPPGVFVLHILDGGGHPGPVVRWLDAGGSGIRPDWDPTVRVEPGETLFAELRSAPYGWQEQAREETVRIRIDFSPEPYPEPNDTLETAVPVEIGEEVAFRLTPRWDRDVFAVTARAEGPPGVFVLHVLESGGHPGPVVRWLDGEGAELRPDWDPTVRARPGETLYAEMRSAPYGWQEQAREETVILRIDFSAEPYPEPSDTPETAVPVEIGEEVAFRLTPRWDRDVFAVTAPADGPPGVLAVRILDGGGHPGPVVRWLDAEGAEIRPDWDPTVRVGPGETLFAEMRSAPYGWQEQAREETVRIRIDFSPEPFPEPNDTPATAIAVETGDPTRFRLTPRWDRDVFAVTAPADGELVVDVLDAGGHPGPWVRWLDAESRPVAEPGARTAAVTAGATVFAEIRSAPYGWQEQARDDELTMRIRHRLPDGRWWDEIGLADGMELRPWQRVEIPAGARPPRFLVTAPQPGLYRAVVEGPAEASVRWADPSGAMTGTGPTRRMERGDRAMLDILPVEAYGSGSGWVVGLELVAVSAADPAGIYPRLPPLDRLAED